MQTARSWDFFSTEHLTHKVLPLAVTKKNTRRPLSLSSSSTVWKLPKTVFLSEKDPNFLLNLQKNKTMIVTDTLYSIFTNRCTRCHQGKIFSEKNPYIFSKMFNMHKNCSHCGLKFEKEPDFFYGAMYASYALTSGWFIIWFLIQTYFLQWDVFVFIFFFLTFILLLSPMNLRWSRILWLSLFFPFDKDYKTGKKNPSEK